jgi:hypothetical protein
MPNPRLALDHGDVAVYRNERGTVVIDVDAPFRALARLPEPATTGWQGGYNADAQLMLHPAQAVALLKALMGSQELRIAAGFGEADEVAHVATNGLAR